jgi:hypothetical protein
VALMPGRAVRRPRSVAALGSDDALELTVTAVQKLQAERQRDHKVVDLLIGRNRVRHGLGRPAVGYTITPTFLTIAFGHAISTENPRPELEVWIDVVGSDQFKARVEIW